MSSRQFRGVLYLFALVILTVGYSIGREAAGGPWLSVRYLATVLGMTVVVAVRWSRG